MEAKDVPFQVWELLLECLVSVYHICHIYVPGETFELSDFYYLCNYLIWIKVSQSAGMQQDCPCFVSEVATLQNLLCCFDEVAQSFNSRQNQLAVFAVLFLQIQAYKPCPLCDELK